MVYKFREKLFHSVSVQGFLKNRLARYLVQLLQGSKMTIVEVSAISAAVFVRLLGLPTQSHKFRCLWQGFCESSQEFGAC